MFLKILTNKITSFETRRFVLSIFIVALLLRIVIIFVIGDHHSPQMWEHGPTAQNMLRGHGFSFNWPYEPIDPVRKAQLEAPPQFEGAFLPPLNPYLIYWMFLLFGDNPTGYLAYMLLNALFSSLSVVAVYYVARLFKTTELQSRISAIFMAFFLPGAVAVTSFSGSPSYQLLALLVMYFCIRSAREGGFKNFALLGIVTGVLTLARSEILVLGFILINTAGIIYFLKYRKTSIFPKVAMSVLLALVTVAPWTYRNYQLFDRFIPVVSPVWYNIWRGYHNEATGGSLNTLGRPSWVYPDLHRQIIMKIDSLPFDQNFEVEFDRVFKGEVIGFIQENPGKAFFLTVKKAVMFWTIEPGYPRASNPVYLISIFFIIICFVIGFIRYWRTTHDFAVIAPYMLVVLYYTAIFAITLPLPRYQIYILSIVMPFTGIGFSAIFGRFLKSENSHTPLIQDQ